MEGLALDLAAVPAAKDHPKNPNNEQGRQYEKLSQSKNEKGL